MDTLVNVMFIMGLAFGAVAILHITVALLYLPMYLMGYRTKHHTSKETI